MFPLAGQFGTAFWVALLTAGLTALMARDTGAGEAVAQANALGLLAWVGAGVTVLTLIAALMLRNPPKQTPVVAATTSNQQTPTKG